MVLEPHAAVRREARARGRGPPVRLTAPACAPLQKGARALVICESISLPLVVFVDEIDQVRALPFPTDDFFAIRNCYNRRVHDPEFDGLLLPIGTALPSGAESMIARLTPFNVGVSIDLTDFSMAEVAALEPVSARRKLSGRRCWSVSTTGPGAIPTSLSAFAVLSSIRQTLPSTPTWTGSVTNCSSPEYREQEDNLNLVQDRLLRGPDDTAALLKSLRPHSAPSSHLPPEIEPSRRCPPALRNHSLQ